eukprot:TRINITY_DN2212_c0_g1_i1.p1 TRINITY_DN2212_c0_g1~~TRINITY_DN2212_c0_g1_i1.p1  ORF type:complete len:123 (-),score=30.29 TRINITY_DN2212_c0_g1_i1:48-416(-)
MKDTALKKIKDAQVSSHEIDEDSVMWIVTVPGMAKDAAKQFMRKAASEAGMCGRNNLMLALEPEAASLCVKRDYGEELPIGSQYIVVDCGGGTVDFACHQIVTGGCRETHHAVGGPWGSDMP